MNLFFKNHFYVFLTIQRCHIYGLISSWQQTATGVIISEITWREAAPSERCGERPIELYDKFEENCRLEWQTTVFTCMHSGCLPVSFAKCKRMGPGMRGMYAASIQIWGIHREKQSVWNFFITWQFHWLSRAWSADSAVSNNELTKGRISLESSSGQTQLPSVNMGSIRRIKGK